MLNTCFELWCWIILWTAKVWISNKKIVTLSLNMFSFFLFFILLLLLLFFIVVDFVIHWNETAMGLHVFPIPIPPPTSLSTRSLQVFPVHQVRALVSCIQPGLVILNMFSYNIKWRGILKGLILLKIYWNKNV